MHIATADAYADVLSRRVAAERQTLAARWLARLNELLVVPANEVFPSAQLLDHIPLLIGHIAAYLSAPADDEIAANTAVITKAQELGQLRHAQKASVHQLLREYELLGEILETFIVEETERLGLQPSVAECFEVIRRLTRSSFTLLRTTVDTFVREYTTTIEERNSRIGTFNQMASHELRSPIGTLLFASQLITTEAVIADRTRLTRVAGMVRTNAERLAWLVENLGRLAQIDGPRDVPSEQNVDVGTLAREVLRQLDEMAVARDVHLSVAEGMPSIVVDPARLELVLLNLTSNAIKYCDPGKPARLVEIGAEPMPADGRTCVIFVRDNGLGIPEADQPAIFDRFVRAHADLDGTLGVTGSGLGLAIVADCVQALGGAIRVESRPRDGSTFYVTLPTGGGAST
jgi:signal transduction histidine kinase